jgi:hypothetical protein
MKITTEQIIDRENLVGRIVLHCLANSIKEIDKIRENGHAEIKLIINEKEYDIKSFVEHWQAMSQKP